MQGAAHTPSERWVHLLLRKDKDREGTDLLVCLFKSGANISSPGPYPGVTAEQLGEGLPPSLANSKPHGHGGRVSLHEFPKSLSCPILSSSSTEVPLLPFGELQGYVYMMDFILLFLTHLDFNPAETIWCQWLCRETGSEVCSASTIHQGCSGLNNKPRSGFDCTTGPESKHLPMGASRWSCRPLGQGADFVVVPSVEGWTFVTLPKSEATRTKDKPLLSSAFPHQSFVLLPHPEATMNEHVNISAGSWSTRPPS